MLWYSVNIFELVSNTINLPLDQLRNNNRRLKIGAFTFAENPIIRARAFVCVICSLILSDVHRTVLNPRRVSSTVRHASSFAIGIVLVSLCFGWEVIHLIISSCVAYAMMHVIPHNVIHGYIFAWSIFYQSVFHAYAHLISDTAYTINISGPLVLLTQKLTYVSFSVQQNYRKRNEDNESEKDNKSSVILPTPLEYFSYAFHFSSVFAGPTIDIDEYKQCISGTQYSAYSSMKNSSQEPSPYKMVLQKLLTCIMSFIIFVNAFKICPTEGLTEPDFLENTSIAYKTLYVSCTMIGFRYRYYVAWLLGESAEHLFGLGFNGYSENGTPKWDKNDNVNILGFETALNLKEIIDNWNIRSSTWLRRLVYEMTTFYPTVTTLVVSALWHGFYAGYFLTFLTIALALSAARQVRRKIRPYFQRSWMTRYLYHALTYVVTHAALSYSMAPFMVMTLAKSMAIWRSVYFIGHIAFITTLVVLHFIPRPITAQTAEKKSN